MTLHKQDIICAIATGTGGAIGVIRISGNGTIALTDKIFSKDVTKAKPYTLHYGEIADSNGKTIDQVLLSVFHAPHSYTGEESVDITIITG